MAEAEPVTVMSLMTTAAEEEESFGVGVDDGAAPAFPPVALGDVVLDDVDGDDDEVVAGEEEEEEEEESHTDAGGEGEVRDDGGDAMVHEGENAWERDDPFAFDADEREETRDAAVRADVEREERVEEVKDAQPEEEKQTEEVVTEEKPESEEHGPEERPPQEIAESAAPAAAAAAAAAATKKKRKKTAKRTTQKRQKRTATATKTATAVSKKPEEKKTKEQEEEEEEKKNPSAGAKAAAAAATTTKKKKTKTTKKTTKKTKKTKTKKTKKTKTKKRKRESTAPPGAADSDPGEGAPMEGATLAPPRNAFAVFSASRREHLQRACPQDSSADLRRRLRTMWNEFTPSQKAVYERAATGKGGTTTTTTAAAAAAAAPSGKNAPSRARKRAAPTAPAPADAGGDSSSPAEPPLRSPVKKPRVQKKASSAAAKAPGGDVPTRRLVFSSMDIEPVFAESIIASLGDALVEEAFSDRATHVVVSSGPEPPKRTLKVLLGIARGCWIVSSAWLYRSLEAGLWLPESEFEVAEWPGPRASRLAHERTNGGGPEALPFDGLRIYLEMPLHLSEDALVRLVGGLGGKVVSKAAKSSVFVTHFPTEKRVPEDLKAAVVEDQWIVESVTVFERLPLSNYRPVFPGGGITAARPSEPASSSLDRSRFVEE